MFRDLTEEDNTASQIALRNCLDVKEEQRYIGIFDEKKKRKRTCSWTSKYYCQSSINRHKLISLVLYYVWEDVRIWAHWNCFLDMHLNHLGPVSRTQNISYFSPSWQLESPSWVGWGLGFSCCHSGCWLDRGQHLLFTGMTDNFPFPQFSLIVNMYFFWICLRISYRHDAFLSLNSLVCIF